MLCTRTEHIYANDLCSKDAPEVEEFEFVGNPLLTYNMLRAGAAGVSGEGDTQPVARYVYEEDAWYVLGTDGAFSDIEIIAL